jgi:hypothetical protein
MLTAEQVDRPPGPGWNARGALNLPDTWFLVAKHLPPGFPMPVATFVAFFFEETGCCNMVQQGTPAAIGPGQLQISEQGKVDFFASKDPTKSNLMGGQWDTSMTIMAVNQRDGSVFIRQKRLHPDLPELTKGQILADNEFAIKMHAKYFQWLARGFADGKPKGLDGLLAAQTGGGGNVAARQLFTTGGEAVARAMQPDPSIDLRWSDAEWKMYYAKRRKTFIAALNIARQFHSNQVPERFDKFWEFFLPDDFLQNPLGYAKLGF